MSSRDPGRFQNFYAKEAEVYHDRRYGTRYGRLFAQLHHETLVEMLGEVAGRRALEVACGTGHTSALLASLGVDLVACDLTSEMMAGARERTRGAAVPAHFLRANALALPFPDQAFDLLVSTRFMHLFPYDEQRDVLAEMARVLRPGARLIVDFDNWFSRWLLSVPYALYNLVRYQRLAPYSVYNRMGQTCRMLESVGFEVSRMHGLGGSHLLPVDWIHHRSALRSGRAHRHGGLRWLAEQFMVECVKR